MKLSNHVEKGMKLYNVIHTHISCEDIAPQHSVISPTNILVSKTQSKHCRPKYVIVKASSSAVYLSPVDDQCS